MWRAQKATRTELTSQRRICPKRRAGVINTCLSSIPPALPSLLSGPTANNRAALAASPALLFLPGPLLRLDGRSPGRRWAGRWGSRLRPALGVTGARASVGCTEYGVPWTACCVPLTAAASGRGAAARLVEEQSKSSRYITRSYRRSLHGRALSCRCRCRCSS